MKRFLDMSRVMAVMLAGGYGNRLYPLTRRTPKPGVSVGGTHRMIDFNLSNLVNSSVLRIYTTVQYGSADMVHHLAQLQDLVSPRFRQGLYALPPGDYGLFASDADSLVQNIGRFDFTGMDYVILCAADQITAVDFRPLVTRLIETEADAVFAYKVVTVDEAKYRLGVFELNKDGMVLGMEEQPPNPKSIPGLPHCCTSNPYMYAFKVSVFQEMLTAIRSQYEAHLKLSETGLQWLFMNQKRIAGLGIEDMAVPGSQGLGRGFWVDAGTVDDYYKIQTAFTVKLPVFDFYNPSWFCHTAMPFFISPAKLNDVTVDGALCGYNSIVQGGATIAGSVISSGVNVGTGSVLKDCVILPGAVIGDGVDMSRIIVDEGAVIPNGFRLHASEYTLDRDQDFLVPEAARKKFNGKEGQLPLVLTEGGVMVITKDYFLE